MIIILYIKVKNLKESNEKIISNVRKNKINIDKYLENSSELLDWKKIFDYLIELNWVERKVTIKNDLQVVGNVTVNKNI